jgi:hypothetical protein
MPALACQMQMDDLMPHALRFCLVQGPLTGYDSVWCHLAAPARCSITMIATVSALARYHALSYAFASLTLYIRR